MDYAATAYVDPRVKKAMDVFWTKEFGNPGAIYDEGREAKKAVETARKDIAKIIGAKSEEIIFTSGGTESNNLAIFGVCGFDCFNFSRLYPQAGSDAGSESRQSKPLKIPHIITTKFEHHAVLYPIRFLEKQGFNVTYLNVGEDGIVNPEDVKKALKKETILVSIMYANNEIGTIQPIAEIGKIIKNCKLQTKNQKTVFHIDACQASGYLNLDVSKLGVDLMTINGSKMYGPKGVGFLYVKNGVNLAPMMYGGGQEKGLRPGTENVPGIIGIAEALKIAQKETKQLIGLRDYFIKRLLSEIPETHLNGHPKKRLPNNVNVSILGIEGESVILYLDELGISCSTGSACNSESLDPSHVILALGKSHGYAHGSIRFTLGKRSAKKDIDYVMKVLPDIVKKLRSISAVKI